MLNASALLEITIPTVLQLSISEQFPQVSYAFPSAHCLIGHKLSQKGVFAPSAWQPSQFIISAVISTPFISLHSFATFSLSALSLLSVAARASHFSQSSPQYAISFFIGNLPLFQAVAERFQICFGFFGKAVEFHVLNCAFQRVQMHQAHLRIFGFQSEKRLFRADLDKFFGTINFNAFQLACHLLADIHHQR